MINDVEILDGIAADEVRPWDKLISNGGIYGTVVRVTRAAAGVATVITVEGEKGEEDHEIDDDSFVSVTRAAKRRHAEQRDGEIYMGNTTMNGFEASSWSSKRPGTTPSDHDGNFIAGTGFGAYGFGGDNGQIFPWFITRADVEQKIRAEESSNGPNAAEKTRLFQSMLADDFDPCTAGGAK